MSDESLEPTSNEPAGVPDGKSGSVSVVGMAVASRSSRPGRPGTARR